VGYVLGVRVEPSSEARLGHGKRVRGNTGATVESGKLRVLLDRALEQ
jgi:hypothetical protein